MDLASAFLFYALLVFLGVRTVLRRYGAPGFREQASILLTLWLFCLGWFAHKGVLQLPGMLGGIVVYLVYLVWSKRLGELAGSLPAWLLIGAQVFRLPVELFLERMHEAALVPQSMTFHGANFDILTAVTAPLVAWLVYKQKVGRGVVIAWNIGGLLLLANVMVRGVLSAPGPLHVLHSIVPNIAVTMFPYVWLVALFVPLAATLHVLSLRRLGRGV